MTTLKIATRQLFYYALLLAGCWFIVCELFTWHIPHNFKLVLQAIGSEWRSVKFTSKKHFNLSCAKAGILYRKQ